jgi:hypothetical protein
MSLTVLGVCDQAPRPDIVTSIAATAAIRLASRSLGRSTVARGKFTTAAAVHGMVIPSPQSRLPL